MRENWKKKVFSVSVVESQMIFAESLFSNNRYQYTYKLVCQIWVFQSVEVLFAGSRHINREWLNFI